MKHLIATAVLAMALAGHANTAHADGDVEAGEKLFKSQCQRCHTIEQGGKDRVGPNLFGVFGATAGQRSESFEKRYSTALKDSGVVWSEETLDGYLENPRKFIPKNRMGYAGLKDEDEREDLIAFLKSVQ